MVLLQDVRRVHCPPAGVVGGGYVARRFPYRHGDVSTYEICIVGYTSPPQHPCEGLVFFFAGSSCVIISIYFVRRRWVRLFMPRFSCRRLALSLSLEIERRPAAGQASQGCAYRFICGSLGNTVIATVFGDSTEIHSVQLHPVA